MKKIISSNDTARSKYLEFLSSVKEGDVTLHTLKEEDMQFLPERLTVKLYFGNRRYYYKVILARNIPIYLKQGYVEEDLNFGKAYTTDAYIVPKEEVASYYKSEIQDETNRLLKDKEKYCSTCVV